MAFLKPGKRAFHHPPLGHDTKGVEFIALGNLYGRPQNLMYTLSKRAPRITTIDEHAGNLAQGMLVLLKRFQCPLSIRDIGCRHRNSMGESFCINGNMAFNARYLLPRIIAFVLCRIRVFDALGINDQKGAACAPTMFDTGRANLIFLMPAPAGLTHFPTASLSIA